MFSIASIALAATAGVVSASPVQSQTKSAVLPLKYIANVTSAKNIVDRGHARISNINGGDPARLAVRQSSGTVTNEDVTYVAPISVGGQTWQLIVDTGSSNLWCGAQSPCEQTSTGQDTGDSVSVNYGNSANPSSFSGEEYTDEVSFGGLTVSSQSLGAASSTQGFQGVDGIIGFGPADLTANTVSNTDTVPTFMDNLYQQGSISEEVLGVYFEPESGSDTDDANGELTLGGTDSSKYSGSITYFPRLTSGRAASYWGISISSFTYGSKTLASSASGIVDTGTTLIFLPTSAYNSFLSATGGSTDQSSGLVIFSTKPTSNFGFNFGSKTFTLTPSQYLVAQSQYSNFGLTSGKYYAWFADGGSSGVNTIIGQKFLENYYSVYDTTNSRIGFAKRT